MNARTILKNLSIKHDGDFMKIVTSLQKKEEVEDFPYEGNYITYLDNEYPFELRNAIQPPFVLYYEGDINLLKQDDLLSICGDTYDGLEIIDKNFHIIFCSKTVPAIWHKCSKLIFVMPCGLDCGDQDMNCIKHKVLEGGGLVITEYPNGTKPTNERKFMVSRISERLAKKTLVFQVKKHSGALVNVSRSLEYGNDIYVVPTDIRVGEYYENNKLIKDGANLCDCKEDLDMGVK